MASFISNFLCVFVLFWVVVGLSFVIYGILTIVDAFNLKHFSTDSKSKMHPKVFWFIVSIVISFCVALGGAIGGGTW